MADSVRKRIRDDIVATLRTISFIEHVSVMTDEPAEARHEFPAVVVHPVDDVPAPAGSGALGFATRRAGFAIEAWVCEKSTGTLGDDVEAFLADVIEALGVDPSRGGLALDTRVGSVAFLLLTREQRLGGFELELVSSYRYPAGRPSG